VRVRGTQERCIRGHVYDRVVVRPDGTIHQICNSCERMNEREKHVANGGVPRAVRNAPLDMTRTYKKKPLN